MVRIYGSEAAADDCARMTAFDPKPTLAPTPTNVRSRPQADAGGSKASSNTTTTFLGRSSRQDAEFCLRSILAEHMPVCECDQIGV